MKLCASNLAWPLDGGDPAIDCLAAYGFEGMEIAPGRIWPDWADATPAAGALVRKDLAARGLRVPALQAVLFGVPNARLFGEPAQQAAFVAHLLRIAPLAASLGAGVVVLGAPRARMRGSLSLEEALDHAAGVLGPLCASYLEHGVQLCIEPNPVEYGCDFVVDSVQGQALCAMVPGLGLHLDAAGMTMAGEDTAARLSVLASGMPHFHASEPGLAPLAGMGIDRVDHAGIAAGLHAGGYQGWVSLEMLAPAGPTANALEVLERALAVTRQCYASPVRPCPAGPGQVPHEPPMLAIPGGVA